MLVKTLYSHSASTQVYKLVPANSMRGGGGGEREGDPAMYKHPSKGEIPIASCYRNGDKLRPDGPLASYTDKLTLPIINKAKQGR